MISQMSESRLGLVHTMLVSRKRRQSLGLKYHQSSERNAGFHTAIAARIHSGTSACDGSVKVFEVFVHNVSASLQMFHFLRPLRFINPFQDRSSGLRWWTFQTLWRPNCVASLHRRVSCFRLIFCRALCNAMERVFLFTRSPSRLRSRYSLHISIIVSSCESRYDFVFFFLQSHRFTAECAIAFVTAPKSGISSQIRNGSSHITSVSPYAKLQFFTHVTE